jgi:hypothetical protein
VLVSLVVRERSRRAWSTGILATPDDKASIMIIISVDDEMDEDIFIFGVVFRLGEGEADSAGIKKDCSGIYQQVS